MLLGHHSISQSPARFLKPTTGKLIIGVFSFRFILINLPSYHTKGTWGAGSSPNCCWFSYVQSSITFESFFWLNHWITENWNNPNCCVFNRCTFFVESLFFVVYRWVHVTVTSHQASPRPPSAYQACRRPNRRWSRMPVLWAVRQGEPQGLRRLELSHCWFLSGNKMKAYNFT